MFQCNYIFILLLLTGVYTFPESQDYDYSDDIAPQWSNEIVEEEEKNMNENWPPFFVNKGENINLKEGETFRISCDTVEPTNRVVLLKTKIGDALLESNVFANHIKLDSYTRITSTGNDNYKVDRVTREDSGIYKCVFINGDSMAEAVYELTVLFAPNVLAKGKEIRTVQKGDSVTLECQSSGNPEPTITWTKEEGKFSSRVEEEEGVSITMENVDRHVEGIYRCTADNGIGKPASTTVQVVVQYPPEIFTEKIEKWPPVFVNKGEKITMKEGETFNVSCDTVEPTNRVVLLKKKIGDAVVESNVFAGHIKLHANTMIVHFGDVSYKVDRVTREDSGIYKCVFINGDSMAEAVYELNVLFAPNVLAKGKEIRTVQKGDSVTLECQGSGNPEPTITWTKEEGKFASGVDEEGFSITMENVNRHVEGIYRCTADNGIGKPASTTVQVVVQYPPKIFTKKSMIPTEKGYRIELACIVDSKPAAKVFWTKDGEPLNQDSGIKQTDTGHRHIITIENVWEELHGSYECTAMNSNGKSVAEIMVPVIPSGFDDTAGVGGRIYSFAMTFITAVFDLIC